MHIRAITHPGHYTSGPMSPKSATHRNPYEPTTRASAPSADIQSQLPPELEDREIHFSGQPGEDDVEELLNLTATAGRNWILLFPIIFGALIILMNASWPWIMCAVGCALFFLVLVSLLSRSFRRANFMTFNPRWDQPVSGSINREGYEIRMGETWGLVRWTYHSNAYHSDTIVAFQSAVQSYGFRIFPRSSIASDEQWQLLQSIAARIHCTDRQTQISGARVAHAKSMMFDKDRDRLLSVPSDAAPFAGPITGQDARYVTTSAAHKRIITRSYWYVAIAMLGMSAVIAGLAGFLLRGVGHDVGPTPTFAVVTALVTLCGGMWIWLQYSRRRVSDRVYVELKGFVSDTSITFDYGFTGRDITWSQLLIDYQDEQRIVMSDPQFEESVTLRSDMFPSTAAWQRCRDLVSEQTMVRGVVIDE